VRDNKRFIIYERLVSGSKLSSKWAK